MNYAKFASRMGETPMRVDYACAVERPLDKPDRIVAWGCAAVALVLVIFVAVGWV